MCEENSPRDAVLSLTKPTVFHGMIDDWDILKWKIGDWTALFGDRQLPFRCGVKFCSPEPLWESRCSKEIMTMKQFSDFQSNSTVMKENRKWLYFDYKYIHEWAASEKDSLGSVTWSKFGFPEINARASTLWIGSAGAHTPCHFDTYGCNLVAQIFGTKQWILFPQDESRNLRGTRVPYEESSIYSEWNFNSPLPEDFYHECKQVFTVNLKPGDVLFVPRHWWHYVESLDTSVSINTWLPSKFDDISRMDEALVKFAVSQISSNLSSNTKGIILNPNEDNTDSMEYCLKIIRACIDNLGKFQEESKRDIEPPSKKFKLEVSSPCKSLLEMKATFIPPSTIQQLKSLMDSKCSCLSTDAHVTLMTDKFSSGINHPCEEGDLCILNKVMNAFCDPDVIRKVREKLTKSFDVHVDPLRR